MTTICGFDIRHKSRYIVIAADTASSGRKPHQRFGYHRKISVTPYYAFAASGYHYPYLPNWIFDPVAKEKVAGMINLLDGKGVSLEEKLGFAKRLEYELRNGRLEFLDELNSILEVHCHMKFPLPIWMIIGITIGERMGLYYVNQDGTVKEGEYFFDGSGGANAYMKMMHIFGESPLRMSIGKLEENIFNGMKYANYISDTTGGWVDLAILSKKGVWYKEKACRLDVKDNLEYDRD